MIASLQNCCLRFWKFEVFGRKIEQQFIQQNGCKIHFFIYLRKTAIYAKELGDDYKRAILKKSIFWRFMELYIGKGMKIYSCPGLGKFNDVTECLIVSTEGR